MRSAKFLNGATADDGADPAPQLAAPEPEDGSAASEAITRGSNS
jgi:hypothetical protein